MTTSARASLQDGGAKEYEKADLQGSDALCAGLQGIVNGIGGVVGVWDKKLVQLSLETLVMFVRVSVMVVVVMTHLLATNSSCRCLFGGVQGCRPGRVPLGRWHPRPTGGRARSPAGT